ncbi:hypothetical protein [Shouchella shacheensis]|uniref:hypothetical protein n=1 Tax=Shouchella shacheensis TaxID=1649580 RepID=UPI00074005E9|nr:hypothetical protein [Shouchella shacheensis]
MELDQLYLISLLVGGGLTLIYVLLADVLDGIFDIFEGWLSPTLILSFITFLSAGGYLLERFSSMNSFVIVGISALLSLALVSVLHVFVLTPLANAEESNTYSDEDLQGRRGEVILSIPKDGFGEVVLREDSGTIAKTAASFEGEPIAAGTNVLVIEVKQGVAYVAAKDTFLGEELI